MSNYTKSTNFASKDALSSGNPLKIVKGTEIDTEFNNIATAVATKTDNSAAAITGGTIDNTAIGGTTAAAGAFTTLAASGNTTVGGTLGVTGIATLAANPVLSGGTANGVAYLNGSKVVTTGSALTFDGTSLKNVQSGGTATLQFNELSFTRAGANYLYATQDTLSYGATAHIFQNNLLNSEWMRLTSTGLGIGTSSPGVKLEVSGAVTNGYTPLVRLSRPSASLNDQFLAFYNGLSTDAQIGRIKNSDDLVFGFNSGVSFSAALTLNTSGNLGLGVTPSAWSLGKAIEVNNTGNALWGVAASEIDVSQNAYYNSGWKYASSSYASRYEQNTGVHKWWNAPYGTAGNAISFTQAMTLDASGNLLVGKTSGVNKIETVGAGLDGNGSVTVTTSATTIYTIKQSDTGALCTVYGDNGSDGFMDLVFFLSGVTPQVITSKTMYGSPGARTYTAATTALKCALASGTMTFRTAVISTLGA